MEEPHLENMLVEEPRVPGASIGGGVVPPAPGDASLPPGQINHEQADGFDWDAVPEPIIDWDAIQIEEKNEYEGNLEIVTDEQFYTLLGLKDEDVMAKEARQEARETARKTKANASADAFPNVEGTEGAAIPVDDCVPGEEIIIYDKNNPIMELGSRYPNMKEFRIAMRQYAINKEFSLKVDATDKKRYRGICKVPGCPWKIHARPERPNSAIIMVTALNGVHILNARTRGLGHLSVVKGDHYAAEIWDNSNCHDRYVVKAYDHECSCEEWQHTGKPCPHALCLITAQPIMDVKMDDFVHDYYSVEKFKNAYKRLVEPMPDRTQWPKVNLPFKLEAPLEKRSVGRQRKNRMKGCLEGGSGKKTVHKDSEKAKKMIRGPVTCPKCGDQGHRRNSSKCRFNAPKKRKRKPRKNTTKVWFPKEVSTSDAIVPANTSEDIVAATSEAIVLGEATSSQLPIIVTSTPTKQPTRKMVAKKITPKKLKKA